MKQLIPMDELIHQSLHIANDLQSALCLVDTAFENLHTPWLEHCVRETVMH